MPPIKYSFLTDGLKFVKKGKKMFFSRSDGTQLVKIHDLNK